MEHGGWSPFAPLAAARVAHLGLPAFLFLAATALGGSISGHVTDRATGNPLADVDMDLYDGSGKRLPKLDARTDASGAFLFSDVPEGAYKVKADPPRPPSSWYVDAFWSGSPKAPVSLKKAAALVLVSAATPAATGIDMQLERGAIISGRIVRAKGGKPLQGIDLDLLSAEGAPLRAFDAKTDKDGRYVLGPVPSGSYLLRADPDAASGLVRRYFGGNAHKKSAAKLDLVAGTERSGTDFSLKARHTDKPKKLADDKVEPDSKGKADNKDVKP